MMEDMRKRMCIYMYICITGSLCCTVEIDRTLKINCNKNFFKKRIHWSPTVAQWLMNPTRNHEVVGWIPGLAQG